MHSSQSCSTTALFPHNETEELTCVLMGELHISNTSRLYSINCQLTRKKKHASAREAQETHSRLYSDPSIADQILGHKDSPSPDTRPQESQTHSTLNSLFKNSVTTTVEDERVQVQISISFESAICMDFTAAKRVKYLTQCTSELRKE